MRITIQARPNAPKPYIEKVDDTHFIVAVTEPPLQGKANRAIIKAISIYFNVKPYQIRIVSGLTSKTKLLEISQ